MSWRRRLFEVACAGGALAALPGCPISGFCGNANPDPCICDRHPASDPQCVAEKKCEDNGGMWDFSDPLPAADAGGQIWGHCDGFPKDAGHVEDATSKLDAEGAD